jgi:hypothetical protein
MNVTAEEIEKMPAEELTRIIFEHHPDLVNHMSSQIKSEFPKRDKRQLVFTAKSIFNLNTEADEIALLKAGL